MAPNQTNENSGVKTILYNLIKIPLFVFSSSRWKARVSTISIGAFGGPPSATSTVLSAAAVTKTYSDHLLVSAAVVWVS